MKLSLLQYSRLHRVLVIIFLFAANQTSGQRSSFPATTVRSNTFTIEHGLSQNSVARVTKDSQGFIWVGTGNGLNRFDGYSFVHFTHSDGDSLSISNNVIRALLLDSKGRLWVGTYDGLNLYDGKTETFRRFLNDPEDDSTISQNTILYLLEDRNHQLWVGTYWGLNRIDLETLAVTRYLRHSDGTGLVDNGVNALLEDRNGKIWACTRQGISIIGPLGVENTIPNRETPDGLPSDVIVDIVQDSAGAIYIATNGNGVLRLENEDDRTFEHFKHVPGKPTLGSNIMARINIDRNGTLLVGTDGAGLYRHEGEGVFTQILAHENKILDQGGVHEIFIDEKNNYWIGLFGAGLMFVPGERPRFEHYQYFDSTMRSIGKNSVLAIAEDHDQKIWIGTDGAGLYKFDPITENFTSYLHSPANRNSLSSNVVKSLLVDDKNNLYIGTYAGGLNYFDTRKNTFTRYLHDPRDKTSISTNHVWSILQGRDQRIYIGQLGALDEFLPEKKVFVKLNIPENDPVNKNTASVFAMTEDRNGNIWMGTRLAGIHRYEPEPDAFMSFLHVPGDSTSLPTSEILELGLDSKGNLLVGTDNKGLIYFDPETFAFTEHLPGFRDANIPSILEDDSRNLWFTSFDGLHKFDPATGRIFNYTVTDGMQGAQFNEGARLKSSTGEFYFGGTNGLNVFRPEQLVEDRSRPDVVFTRLTLYHDEVSINDDSGLLTQSISNTKTVTFQPDQNVFSIEFACIEYKFPKKNRYRYLLENFDKNWNEIGDNRTATYTNLPPGKYNLKVSATNADGYWNEEAATLQIIVIPRWHQRSAIRAGFILLLVLITALVIHARTSFLYKQKKKLEHQVVQRTHLIETQKEEIKDKNKELEQAYEEVNTVNEKLQRVNSNLEKLVEDRTRKLKMTIRKLVETDKGLTTFLYRSSHDLRGPIASLLGLAYLTKIQNRQDDLEANFEHMERTLTGMLRLLKRLNDTSALFRTKRQMKVIHVDDFIQSVKAQLDDLNVDNAVKTEFENQAGESFYSDPFLLNHIVVNLLENSIIFRGTKCPYAKCVFARKDGDLVIEVSDNGVGISPDVREGIFNMFYRGSEKSSGNGLGLFMVKKALEILNGSIDIYSEPEILTKVTVSIPLADGE